MKNNMEPLVNLITLSEEEKQFFSDCRFIKLKQLLTSEAADQLRQLVSQSNAIKTSSNFYS